MTILIGITGGTGSGKTTLAEEVVRSLGSEKAVLLNQDFYYLDLGDLPAGERSRVNFDHPAAFDWKLLRKQLRTLRSGRSISRPVYSFHTHSRLSRTVKVEAHPIIILEGILVFHDAALRRMMDMKVYVEADADVRFIRRLERDIRERGRTMESVTEQYLTSVRPMHLQFIEPTRRYADLIVPGGGQNRVAVEAIIAGVRALL